MFQNVSTCNVSQVQTLQALPHHGLSKWPLSSRPPPWVPTRPTAWWSVCAECVWCMACSVGFCNKASRSKGLGCGEWTASTWSPGSSISTFFSAENIFLLGCFLILNAHLNQEKTRLYPDRGVFTCIYAVFPGILRSFPGKSAQDFGFKTHKVEKCCKYAHLEKICSKHLHITNEHLLCFCAMWPSVHHLGDILHHPLYQGYMPNVTKQNW